MSRHSTFLGMGPFGLLKVSGSWVEYPGSIGSFHQLTQSHTKPGTDT
jgi:hypothetical protein